MRQCDPVAETNSSTLIRVTIMTGIPKRYNLPCIEDGKEHELSIV